MSILNNFPHDCSIQRPEYVQGGGGEFDFGQEIETRPTIADGVRCFVQNMKIDERERWSKKEMMVDTKIYFTAEPNLKEGDFITITKNRKGTSYVGQTFKFKAIDDSTTGFGRAWKGVFERDVNPVTPPVS